MINLNEMHMEVGEVEFAAGYPVTWEAVIYFPALFDSPEIRVNTPDARVVANRIVELWNAAALTTGQR